jgi:hypothetical protein
VKVKLLPEDGELYVFAESRDRIAKERSMRRRQLKWLCARLAQLQTTELSRDCTADDARQRAEQSRCGVATRRGEGRENRFRVYLSTQPQKNLKQVLRREGRYLLRTNLTETDPVKL